MKNQTSPRDKHPYAATNTAFCTSTLKTNNFYLNSYQVKLLSTRIYSYICPYIMWSSWTMVLFLPTRISKCSHPQTPIRLLINFTLDKRIMLLNGCFQICYTLLYYKDPIFVWSHFSFVDLKWYQPNVCSSQCACCCNIAKNSKSQ